MFTPFHYRNRTIGFTILLNGKFLYDNPYFYDIQSLLNRVLWDMYQRKCYIKANRKLDALYKRDALTGLYNRTAYFEQVDKMFEDCRKKEFTTDLKKNRLQSVLVRLLQIQTII